ncbi:MAG: bifunctional aldolase/short-chain dehydrogenase [Nitrospirae bacterium]|nr:bifunctional aldolase/short-chain dehydrogenase [Nitrospirota bacterium]
MKNRWTQNVVDSLLEIFEGQFNHDLALRTYSTQLLGLEKTLVMHGGGNTSVKTTYTNILGETIPALYIKASGKDMAKFDPSGLTGLDLNHLIKLRSLEDLTDLEMINEFKTHMFDHLSDNPSLETLVHANINAKFIDHTHPDSILVLASASNAKELIKEALGDDVIILDYFTPGFKLAKACADAFDASPKSKAMILMHHGLITWGETAKESYDLTINLVTKAEKFINKKISAKPKTNSTSLGIERYKMIAPILRGILTGRSKDVHSFKRFILMPMLDDNTLEFVDSKSGKELAQTPPITTDYLIRTKAFPLWIVNPNYDDMTELRKQLLDAIKGYKAEYEKYYKRHKKMISDKLIKFDPMPRVIMMPGLGVICAGRDIYDAEIARDITEQTINVKTVISEISAFSGLSEDALFNMEYRSYQHSKLGSEIELPLLRQVAIVTGCAGAIGSGISRALLNNGCHVALTDLAGDNLNSLYKELSVEFGKKVIAVPMDVTDIDSVSSAFGKIIENFGGIDILIVNAGIAMVSSIEEMSIDKFRKLERVNVEGTLIVLAEAARHFRVQQTGGDIVLISTKNVFAPGAGFGAYSATKSASHQLARIASLEFAGMDVRVNMVAPDAVFSDKGRKSGLWAEVGPDRMKARGLNEAQLQEYYRDRNLLKLSVTADHVANAVLFFLKRLTPTTGATIPVDGGLPDATPR